MKQKGFILQFFLLLQFITFVFLMIDITKLLVKYAYVSISYSFCLLHILKFITRSNTFILFFKQQTYILLQQDETRY